MHLAQEPDRLVRRVPLRPAREADEVGEEDGGVLLAHLRQRLILAGEAIDGRRREVAREVAALAFERRLPLDQPARARDDERKQRRDDQVDHDVLDRPIQSTKVRQRLPRHDGVGGLALPGRVRIVFGQECDPGDRDRPRRARP